VTAENWGDLYRIIELVLIPFGIYLVRTLTSVASELKELKTVLIGIDGKNGIRSRVIRVERRIERLAAAQAHRHGEEDDDDDV
jgi:hypothetical protein